MTTDRPKIAFLGTPEFAATALQSLIDTGYIIVGVITQPDRPSGRGGRLAESAVKTLAMHSGLPVFQPENKKELTEIVAELRPDLMVVAAYGMIIPKPVLDIPKFGALNIHGSLLPEYRGASPVTCAILDGKAETGVTIMKLAEKMDAGDIISTVKVPIADNDTSETLMAKLSKAGAEELLRVLPDYLVGRIQPKKQDDEVATYCKLINKSDGIIDWKKTASEIERMVRAYNPWPGAQTTLFGKVVKIYLAKVVENDLEAGKIVVQKGKILVGTSEHSLEILSLQPEGKKPMTAREFLNGIR